MDMHRSCIKSHETLPLNWSTETCSRYIHQAPYTKVSINILPLIEELNRTKRNFYATVKDRALVRESYLEWARGDGPLIVCTGFDKMDSGVTSRLSDKLESVAYNQTYWLTREGWKMEQEKREHDTVSSTEVIIEEEKEDEEGNYVDQTTYQKFESGCNFRNSAKGVRMIDWIQDLVHGCQVEDPNTLLENRKVDTFIHSQQREITDGEILSVLDELVAPEDSVSNPDHHNALFMSAVQGWDDDPSIEELGWTALVEANNVVEGWSM